MKKKKRELKTQLVTLSLIMTMFLSSFSVVDAFGYSIKELAFTHGEVTISTNLGNESSVTSLDSFDIVNYLQFTFDAYYTGSVRLNYTYGSSNPLSNINDWNVIVIGGTILSKAQSSSSSYITFQVTDRNEFTVIMTYNYSTAISSWNAGTNPVFNFTSASSSLSAVTNHNNEYNNIAHIDAQIVDVNTNLSSIITRLTTANGLYTDILANTNDIESYLAQLTDSNVNTLIEQYLGNIQLNLASMYSQQQTANTTLSSIYSSLGTLDPNSSDVDILSAVNLISSNINGLAQNVQNLYARVNEINSNVASIKSTLTNMQQDLSSLLSTVQGIDNLIDNITWNSFRLSKFYDSNFNEVVNTGTSNVYYIPLSAFSWLNEFHNFIYYIYLPFFPNSTSSYFSQNYNIDLILYYNGNVTVFEDAVDTYINTVGGTKSMALIKFNNFYVPSADNYYLRFTLSGGGLLAGRPAYLSYNSFFISDVDIEYWSLLSYIQQMKQYQTVNNFDASLYSKLNDIIDAINNIQVTVNVTEQEITNITNNFDTDINTIHNVENNFKIDFDGWNNQLPSSDLSIDLSPYNSTVNFLKTNITNLWSNPFVNLPIIVSCLCFVFMVILG